MTREAHTLVVYGASERADAVLRDVAEAVFEHGGRLTVHSLLIQESEKNGCCDTRSVLWNDVQRGLTREGLARARLAVDDSPDVEFEMVAGSSCRRRAYPRGARAGCGRDRPGGRAGRPHRWAATASSASQQPSAGARGRSRSDRS